MRTDRLIDAFFTAVKNKDLSALEDIFSADAEYVTHDGASYRGLSQIQEHFNTLFFEGETRAWNVRSLIKAGAVEWYYEYRFHFAGSVSYDGVSLFETRDGRIQRWRDYVQAVNKTYPLESRDIDLLQTAGRVEICADWIETLAMHDEKFRSAAEKLQGALDDLTALLPDRSPREPTREKDAPEV